MTNLRASKYCHCIAKCYQKIVCKVLIACLILSSIILRVSMKYFNQIDERRAWENDNLHTQYAHIMDIGHSFAVIIMYQ